MDGARQRWADGALSRPGARRRYLTMAVIIAVLASLPAIVGAIPVDAKKVPVRTLLARIKASAKVSYTGLASSSGTLGLPDLGMGQEVIDLLSQTNRLRVWYAGPQHYRVDRLTAGAENDVYRNGRATWTWDSNNRYAQYTENAPQIPLPGPQDVLPANLGRRVVAQARASEVQLSDSARIAGRPALGLTWRPKDKRSLIGLVKVWADADTGVPLAVEIREVGGKARAFSSSFLDISFTTPSKAQLTFHPAKDPTATVDTTQAGVDDTTPRAILPATLGGLRRRSPMKPLVATYGQGASLVAVADLGDPGIVASLRSQIDSPSRPPIKGAFGTGSLIEVPLVNALVFASKDAGYVLVGTVTRDQLEAMALDLVKHPPRQVGGPQFGTGRP